MLARAVPRMHDACLRMPPALRPQRQFRSPHDATFHHSVQSRTNSTGSKSEASKPDHRSKTGSGSSDVPTDHPRMTLKDLGASRTTRIVVLVALGIAGTAETILWAGWLWRKFGPETETEAEEEPVEEKAKKEAGSGEMDG